MSATDFGSLALSLLALILAAQVLGRLFAGLKQPRVVGEIVAGLLLGPSILGRLAPAVSDVLFSSAARRDAAGDVVMGFLAHLGLVLLMFASGSEVNRLFRRTDRREVTWLAVVGTGLPFVIAVVSAPNVSRFAIGAANQPVALWLVIGIAFAVTSIPIIARIFHDLQISHTRFARIVLSVAVVEDIVLWAILAIATALATSSSVAPARTVVSVSVAVLFFVVGLTLLPRLVEYGARRTVKWEAQDAPLTYVIALILACSALAARLGVNLAFAAFLIGYSVGTQDTLTDATRRLNKVSFALFIPVYFAIVGYRIDLATFSLGMVLATVLLASAVKLLSAGLGATIGGFGVRDAANLAVALNARGGPGIVLASVAYEHRIINAEFYTTLIVLAVVTSLASGAWLEYVVRSGGTLLSADADAMVAAQREGRVVAPISANHA